MIHRIVSLVDEVRLPRTILSKVWVGNEKTVTDLKVFGLTTKPQMYHMDWRVIDLFVDYLGGSDETRLNDLFCQPAIDIESFRYQVSRHGFRPSRVQKSLEKWMAALDRFFIECSFSKEDSQKGQGNTEALSERREDIVKPPKERSAYVDKRMPIDQTNQSVDKQKERSLSQAEDLEVAESEHLISTEPQEGIGPYSPVDVNNSYHNGFLYYPIRTIIGKRVQDKGKDEERITEIQETVVIRSDRTLQKIVKSDRHSDSSAGQEVYRLTDGTLIHSIPKPNIHGTWNWDYINKFINGVDSDVNLSDAIRTIRSHLMSRVWLPLQEDYTLLAITAVVSYVQSIFESVPLILLMGPAGSGKSELGGAMSEVSANATMIGQVSAPTMARLIDESGGLCVIDDLESVGVSNNKAGARKISDIAQVLKVSYKRSTARRMVTNPQTRRTEVMNFFGVKIVSNTSGVDDILGTRMMQVHTKQIDNSSLEEFQRRTPVDERTIDDLRNRLHTWAFENVETVKSVYARVSSSQSDRAKEIAEPLWTIAELSNDEELQEGLRLALKNQERRNNQSRDPEMVLKDVLSDLVKEGYKEVAITHVVLELRRQMDPGYEIDYRKEMPGWSKQEWVGRTLRRMGVVNEATRKRLNGKNLRIIKINKQFIAETIGEHEREGPAEEKSFKSFCQDCQVCPYRNYSCELREG